MDRTLASIDCMKYSELQKMAKRMGIKANTKIDKLQKAIKDYYLQTEGNGEDSKKISADNHDSSATEKSSSSEEESSGKTSKRVTSKAKRRHPAKRIKDTVEVVSPAKKSSRKSPLTRKTTPSFGVNTPQTIGSQLNTSKPASLQSRNRTQSKLTLSMTGKPKTPQSAALKSNKSLLSADRTKTPLLIRKTTKSQSKTTVASGSQSKTTTLSSSADRRSTPQMKAVIQLKEKASTASPKRKRSSSPQRKESDSELQQLKPLNKRIRRSTFDKSSEIPGSPVIPCKESTSPGVRTMISAMKPEMSSEERKETLLKCLDEKVRNAQNSSPRLAENKSSSSIPRFAAFLAKKREQKKPVTPGNKDWSKVHQKEFAKFDSIDVYLEKKRQRTKSITKTTSNVNAVIEASKKAISSLKIHQTPNNENKLLNRPTVQKTPKEVKTFKPTVFKTKNINTTFVSEDAKLKPDEQVLGKKPSVTPGLLNRKSMGIISTKKPAVTPFRFTAKMNMSVIDGKSAKKAFDLQASLARPMSWKPHVGKLRDAGSTSYAPLSSVKSPKVNGRHERREAMTQHRADKKLQAQMARRGVVS